MTDERAPQVFISYRWTSPDFINWVEQFAASLRAHGVDARLDQWHLNKGQDITHFMEQARDERTSKVLIVCDRSYAERADNREGGVGTEAQIISSQVYESIAQTRVAAIVKELNEDGLAILPIFMRGRSYFDMSSPEAEADNFEAVVRWIFDQPYKVAPPIGKRPVFDKKAYHTGSAAFKFRTSSQITSNRSSEIDAFFKEVALDTKDFILDLTSTPDRSIITDKIAELRPISENCYSAIRELLLSESGRRANILHSFLESILENTNYSPMGRHYSRDDADVLKYFAHDMLVSFVAICVDLEEFELCDQVLATPFSIRNMGGLTCSPRSYESFFMSPNSLQALGREKSRTSLHADLLFEGHDHSKVSQLDFMQADIILHLRSLQGTDWKWHPISCLYLVNEFGALPAFIRASSRSQYAKLKSIIRLGAEDLRQVVNNQKYVGDLPRYGYERLNIARLVAASNLAAQP